MTIRIKIVGGLALIALIGLILGAVGLISVRDIRNISNEMHEIQLETTDATTVLNAHFTWRHTLMESVLAKSEFTGSLDPNSCAFGQWKNNNQLENITDPEILSILGKLDDPHTFIHNSAKNIVALMEEGKYEEAEQMLLEEVLPKTAEVISLLTSLETRYGNITEAKSAHLLDLASQRSLLITILLILTGITVVLLNWKVTESILRPLRTVTSAAETLATGDLDVELKYHLKDQIGQLVDAFQSLADSTKNQVSAAQALANGDLTVEVTSRSSKDNMSLAFIRMVDNLNDMFREIKRSSDQVSTGANHVSDGAQLLAQGSAEQASAVERLSVSIGEIADKTKNNANIARTAADLSTTIKNSAEKGSQQMEHMMQAVMEINNASGEIKKVIKVIDDIAFQTNILALNAAVEAARAGTAGKGFAVVAEEVRNLASKSAEAAKNTGGLIENSVEKANIGLGIATETAASLNEIVDGIHKSAEIVSQIASSSDEQAEAITQINSGIDQVAQVVQQNSATAEESAAASEEMSSQSQLLEQLISRFKLKSSGRSPESFHSAPRKTTFSTPQETMFSLSPEAGGAQKY